MPNELKKIIEQLTQQWNRMAPRLRFLVALAMLATVGGVLWASLRGPVEDYSVLFSGLATEDAAKVVAELKAQNIPFHLDANGSTIEVPTPKVHEIRLSLAGAGLPHGGGVGFEL